MNLFNHDGLKRYLKGLGFQKGDIDEAIRRIQEARKDAKPGTDEWSKLSTDLEQELKNRKLYKEAKCFGLKPDTIVIVIMVIILSTFAFSLDMDSPKALKIAQYIVRLPGIKIGI